MPALLAPRRHHGRRSGSVSAEGAFVTSRATRRLMPDRETSAGFVSSHAQLAVGLGELRARRARPGPAGRRWRSVSSRRRSEAWAAAASARLRTHGGPAPAPPRAGGRARRHRSQEVSAYAPSTQYGTGKCKYTERAAPAKRAWSAESARGAGDVVSLLGGMRWRRPRPRPEVSGGCCPARRHLRARPCPHGSGSWPTHAVQGSGAVHRVHRNDPGGRLAGGLAGRGRGEDPEHDDAYREAGPAPDERRFRRSSRTRC